MKNNSNRNLFEFVEDSVGVGDVPVEEELVDDGEVVAGLRETREQLLHVALRLLLYQPPQFREEPGLTRRAPEPDRVGSRIGEEVEGDKLRLGRWFRDDREASEGSRGSGHFCC